jgi:4-amino-4-deoxy-L-arabinose transferase-like glycosyltransferase
MAKIKKGNVHPSDNRLNQWKLSIKKEHLILLAIFIFAIFIRINVDPNMPFHYDPGKNIVYARAAVQSFPLVPQSNPYFNLGEYYEYQVLFPYLVAFIFKITSFSIVSITSCLAIVSGAALCLTVYFLSLELFNNKVAALVSAFLIAVSKIQLLGYVNYYPQILAMTFMPLACIFLIRYIQSEKFQDLFLVVIFSSLIVLASYIAAFVYFLVVLVALALWSIREKKTIKSFILAPVMTGVLLTFFWLPIVWRHGIEEFVGTGIGDIITGTPSAFTNQPWTFAGIITYSSGTVIAIVLGIIALFIVKKFQWDFKKILLAVWLGLSFILMESYLFKPIFWVDRYFQFFDIALLLLAGVIIAFFIDKLNATGKTNGRFRGYFLLLLLIIPLYGAVHFDTTFGKWGYPSDIAMADYMQGLPPGSLVVAPSSVQSFWFSAISGVHVLGGESPQMLDVGYQGNGDSDTIINSPDLNQKMDLIRKYGVNYIVIPYHESQYLMWNPEIDKTGIDVFNNPAYFDVVKYFSDDYGSTVLLKVHEDLSPKYNSTESNTGVTIAGYLISILGFFGFAYISVSKKWFAGKL